MAITQDMSESRFGVPFPGAYFRIVSATINRKVDSGHSVMLDVAAYAVPPTTGMEAEIEFLRIHGNLEDIETRDSSSFLSLCYEYLASLPEFAGSTPA